MKTPSLKILLLFMAVLFFACEETEIIPDEANTEQSGKKKDNSNDRLLPVKVRVNGRILNFTDQPAVLNEQYNRVMVPLNQTLKRCGFDVRWNGPTEEAYCSNGNIQLVFKKNSRTLKYREKQSNGSNGFYWLTKSTHQLGAPAEIINSRMMVPVHALSDYSKITTATWDKNTKTVNVQYWDEPYSGITWIGEGGSWWYNFQKYVPGEYNPYYDPNKPTIIYIHGWQNGSVSKNFFPHLQIKNDDFNEEWTQNQWVANGWNVGIFHWTNYADEPAVWDAESKIWDARYGDQDMQWLDSKGKFRRENMINLDVGQILRNSYESALANQNPNKDVRLVGHSLGTQLTVRLAREIVGTYGMNSKYTPERIVLMDPAAGNNLESYTKKHNANYNNYNQSTTTAKIVEWYAKYLAEQGMPIEVYRSTALQFAPGANINTPLLKLSAYTNLKPWYTDKFSNNPIEQQNMKHGWPTRVYFWSVKFSAKNEVNSSGSVINRDGVYANTPAWRIRQSMVSNKRYEQKYGNSTSRPNDDFFEWVND